MYYIITSVDLVNTSISLYALAKPTSNNLTCLDNMAYGTVGKNQHACLGNIAYSTVSNTQEPTAKKPTGHTALYEEVKLEKWQ